MLVCQVGKVWNGEFFIFEAGRGGTLRFDISSEEEDEIFIFRQKRKFSILFRFFVQRKKKKRVLD